MIVSHDRKEATLAMFHNNNYRIEGVAISNQLISRCLGVFHAGPPHIIILLLKLPGILDQIMRQKPNHGMDWSVKTKQVFSRSLLKSTKDFTLVSKHTSKTKGDCQNYYYGSFKQTSDYAVLKRKIKKSLERELDDQSSDECVRCNEVGNLIVCSICQKSFHLNCCKPPLVEVPEGEWFCDICDPKEDKVEDSLTEVFV